MNDPNIVVYNFLKAHLSEILYAGLDVPPEGYKPSSGRAIVFKTRGGLPSYEDERQWASLQFKCYGTTPLDAMTGYKNLYNTLNQSSGSLILHAECEILGQPLHEPETNWPIVLTYFNVMVRQ